MDIATTKKKIAVMQFILKLIRDCLMLIQWSFFIQSNFSDFVDVKHQNYVFFFFFLKKRHKQQCHVKVFHSFFPCLNSNLNAWNMVSKPGVLTDGLSLVCPFPERLHHGSLTRQVRLVRQVRQAKYFVIFLVKHFAG
jgi:hypothetical protein